MIGALGWHSTVRRNSWLKIEAARRSDGLQLASFGLGTICMLGRGHSAGVAVEED